MTLYSSSHEFCIYSFSGDASGSFPLQFGSISPGFMNGVQVILDSMEFIQFSCFTRFKTLLSTDRSFISVLSLDTC